MLTTTLILTGGASRRFGSHKPSASWRGRPLVSYALAATEHTERIVVGLGDDVPAAVPVVREHPPGGGPVAAIAAGLAATDGHRPPAVVILLAADLPLITRDHVDRLVAAVTDTAPAHFVDADGRAQWLAAAWPTPLLRDRLAELGDPSGASMRRLYGSVDAVGLPDPDGAVAADVDTPDDLRDLARRQPDGDTSADPRRLPGREPGGSAASPGSPGSTEEER